MRNLCGIVLLIAFISYCDSAKKAYKPRRDAEEEDEDLMWLNEACHHFNSCLHEADSMNSYCNSLDKQSSNEDDDEHDEIHDCAHPTLVLKKDLRLKREERKMALRNCFETGKLDESKSNFQDLSMGSRHQSTCVSRIAEFEQKKGKSKKQQKDEDDEEEQAPQQTKHQCKAAAKRFRERCERLESCCVRAKLCKKEMAKTKLAKEIKNIVEEIKSVRKTCREKTSRVAARSDES